MNSSLVALLAALCLSSGCQERPHDASASPRRAPLTPPKTRAAQPTPIQTSAVAGELLGAPPLCEPSAAIRAPWDAKTVIVADNEEQGELYVFALTAQGLSGQREVELPSKRRPRDVEALAEVDGDLLIVGSQSRNKDCEVKAKRQRLRRVRLHAGGRVEERGYIDAHPTWTRALGGDVDGCIGALFTSPAPALAREVCVALIEAERRASEEQCDVLTVEGATAVGGKVWLGLRSPLVDGRAVMLRMATLEAPLRFDAAALLDLRGHGVRELTVDAGQLWGIAGPPHDAASPFVLWRSPMSGLVPGATLVPVAAGELPPSSEGLVIDEGRAVAVIDGDQPAREGAACRRAAGQVILPLPASP